MTIAQKTKKTHTQGRNKIKRFKKVRWLVIFFFSVSISLYALVVFLSLTPALPLLLPAELQNSFRLRPVAFYLHIGFGAVALVTGAINLNNSIRQANRNLHRNIGKVYVVSIWISSISGFIMAFHSAIGWVDHIGFALLAILWFITTTQAFLTIRNGDVIRHRKWILRSFALTFAAVTLRLWLPILIGLGSIFHPSNPFAFGYPLVSYLAWVPNLIFAELWIRRSQNSGVNTYVSKLL